MPSKKLKITGVTHTFSKDKKGNVIVNHPTVQNKSEKKMNLTKLSGAKTIKQGVKSSKDWHKNNPHTSKTKRGK